MLFYNKNVHYIYFKYCVLNQQSLLHKISEQRTEGSSRTNSDEGGNVSGSTGSSSTQVNRVIQSLAHKYCVDSKNHFDELSKVIQRVLTCRFEYFIKKVYLMIITF